MRSGEDSKHDELWLGDAFDPRRRGEASVPVYVRVAQPRALVAELICGRAAQALRLPAPEVFVIRVTPVTLPKSRMVTGDQNTLFVGSRNIGGQTFAQLLNQDTDSALRLIRDWPELALVAAFDEWTANPDRNTSNLIYTAQTLHIIDHAESFGGSHRQLFPLAELTETAFANRMGQVLSSFVQSNRTKALRNVHAWLAESVPDLDIAELIDQTGIDAWHSAEERADLLNFLEQRLRITHRLLCNRLGHPQLSLQPRQD